MESQFDCIVIGGGISGLTAGFYLKRSGKKITVIDPDFLGGSIQTLYKDGFTLELGANTLVQTPEVEKLLTDLDLYSKIQTPAFTEVKQYVWDKDVGKIVSVPKSPVDLFKTSLFSALEKFQILAGLFRKIPEIKDPGGCSVYSLFRSIFPEAVLSKMVEPVLNGIFGGDAKQIVAKSVMPDLFTHLTAGHSLFQYMQRKKTVGKRKIFHLSGGNSLLIPQLTAGIGESSLRKSRVTSVTRSENNFNVTLENGEVLSAKKVFVATNGHTSANFLKTTAPELSILLSAARYAPLIVVHAHCARSQVLPEKGFGVLFPKNMPGDILGVLFNSQLFPDMAPSDKSLLTICFGGVSHDAVLKKSDEDISQQLPALLKTYLNINDAQILNIHRWPKAIFQYEQSSPEIETEMTRLESAYKGLYFIGADRGGIGVPNRVAAAVKICDLSAL